MLTIFKEMKNAYLKRSDKNTQTVICFATPAVLKIERDKSDMLVVEGSFDSDCWTVSYAGAKTLRPTYRFIEGIIADVSGQFASPRDTHDFSNTEIVEFMYKHAPAHEAKAFEIKARACGWTPEITFTPAARPDSGYADEHFFGNSAVEGRPFGMPGDSPRL